MEGSEESREGCENGRNGHGWASGDRPPASQTETLTRVKNQKCLGYVESEEQIGVTTVPVARTGTTT